MEVGEHMNNNKFELYAPIHKALDTTTDETTQDMVLTGIASTTNLDLEHDDISPEVIASMKEQALNLNFHCDHNTNYKGVIGTIIEVLDTDDSQLEIKAKVLPEYATNIQEKLDFGINFGLSIGGLLNDYISNNDGGMTVKDITLTEISLTPLPANWDSFGTVTTKGLVQSKCLTGACKTIIKNYNNEVDDMTLNENDKHELIEEVIKALPNNEEPPKEEAKPLTSDDVTSMINDAITNATDEITQTVMDQVSQNMSDMIDEKMGDKEEPTDDVPPEEDKACGDTTDEEQKACDPEEDPMKEEQKSLTMADVQKAMLNALTDETVMDKLSKKMWSNKTNNREPVSKSKEVIENALQGLETKQSNMEKGMSKAQAPKELAKLLLKSNPFLQK